MTEPNLPPALAAKIAEIEAQITACKKDRDNYAESMRKAADDIGRLIELRDELTTAAAICREAWCASEAPPPTNAHGLTPEWHPPAPETRKRRTPTEIREAVLTTFAEWPNRTCTVQEFMNSLGAAKSSIERALAFHNEAGLIEWSNGRWRLKNPAADSAAKPAIPSGSDPVPAEPPRDTEE